MDDELPPDPDLDDLPDELRERKGLLMIQGRDPDTGAWQSAPTTVDQLAPAFADLRRAREDDDDRA